MSVNIDIRGEGVRPTLKTSRMSVYLSDTGIIVIVLMFDIIIVIIVAIVVSIIDRNK